MNSIKNQGGNINININNSITNSPGQNVKIKINLNNKHEIMSDRIMSDGELDGISATKNLLKKPATVKHRNAREKSRIGRVQNVYTKLDNHIQNRFKQLKSPYGSGDYTILNTNNQPSIRDNSKPNQPLNPRQNQNTKNNYSNSQLNNNVNISSHEFNNVSNKNSTNRSLIQSPHFK